MNSKLNEMFPNKFEIYLRIKNYFELDKKLLYEVSDSIFGKYVQINSNDLGVFRAEYSSRYLTDCDGYAIYKLYI